MPAHDQTLLAFVDYLEPGELADDLPR